MASRGGMKTPRQSHKMEQSKSITTNNNDAASPHCSSSHRNKSRSNSHDRKERSKKHNKRQRRHESSPSSSSSSSHHRKKKSKHSKKKKHSKKTLHKDKRSSPSPEPTSPPLFTAYPAMTSLDQGGIPLILIQLGGGTEIDLSSMPDRRLASLLGEVLQSLVVHGMELRGSSWRWGDTVSSRQKRGDDTLALLRLVRALLNSVGVTLEAFEDQQKQQELKEQVAKQAVVAPVQNERAEIVAEANVDVAHQKRVERLTSQLLARFDDAQSEMSTLAAELQGICQLLMSGESVQIDGLENAKLKASLGQLFDLAGLELVEMADDDDENEDADNGVVAEENTEATKSYGYALPEMSSSEASSSLDVVLRVCQFKSTNGVQGAPVSWAAAPSHKQQESSSEDEDEGPAPIGTMAAVKAEKRAKRQQSQQPLAKSGSDKHESGREEWMMTPGQHDFLKGIQSKSLQSRTFKNERNRGQSVSSSNTDKNQPINPQVLAQVNAIHQAYAESRGPSLLDAHRQQQQEQKETRQKKEWKWNREKNLDDGRRVDKNALHMVLGGAKTELSSKFQGSSGR